MDVSKDSIDKAQAGEKTETTNVVASSDLAVSVPSSRVAITNANEVKSGEGVLVECVLEGRLRVRAVSYPFNPDWNIQFPRDIRQKNARFVVEELVVATSGGYYRARGNITRLVAASPDRFRIFQADQSLSIKAQIEAKGFTFKKGIGYYEHKKSETIQSYKDILLQDVETQELFEGDVVRQLLGLPPDYDVTKVEPSERHTDRYRFFIQSTSHNRIIHAGTWFLVAQ